MRIAVSGGTGLVGRFIVEEALSRGDDVLILSRRAPADGFFSAPVGHVTYDLSNAVPDLSGCDALVHAAFQHVPGRYRGGEGDDPDGFLRANVDGSIALFEASQMAGVDRVIFLSSRAVYGDAPPGQPLREDMTPQPNSLYGEAKLRAELALSDLAKWGLQGVSLRATGVYGPSGPGQLHKWRDLFDDFRNGKAIAPRVATEVHGDDVASAIRLFLSCPGQDVRGVYNVSDIVLDRSELLTEVRRITGQSGALPEAANPSELNIMHTDRLRSLGWKPGGMALLRASLPAMMAEQERGG